MVILVAIWALQKARDRLTAITRARRHRERRRWRANNYQLEQPSQSLAVDFKGQSLPRQKVGASVFFPVCCRHALLREQIEGGKKPNSITPSCSQFTSSTLTQSMCTLFGYSGACCLNVTTRSLAYACSILKSSSFSPLVPPVFTFL